MTGFADPPAWSSPSSDPDDETFGDVVERARPETVDAFDVALVGEPYDGAVLGRRGAREGPAALRDALAGTKTHHFEAGPVGSVADVGDLQLPGTEGWTGGDDDTWTVQERAAEATRRIHESAAFPVFLGGDNSTTVPNVAPLLDAGSVGAISLDAHLDCRALEDGPSSGTPYRQLFDRGLDAFCVLGARHFETSTTYAEFVRERGGSIVTAGAVCADLDAAIERALDEVGDVEQVYLSLDLDVLDAAHAPGVSAPTPGGLTTREVFRVCRRLGAHPRLAGFEVVECAPRLDRDRKTARAGARAIAHMLAGRTSEGTDRGDANRSPRAGGERR